jgi:RES domain-containing protein
VYSASCGALACLEYLVHVGTDFPTGMILVLIDIPDTLHIERTAGWAPADVSASRRIGDEWLDAKSSVILEAPSVLVPRQKNYLLNPLHPLFAEITIVEQTPFAFDARLLAAVV